MALLEWGVGEFGRYCGRRHPAWDHSYQVKNLCALNMMYGMGSGSIGNGGGFTLLELQWWGVLSILYMWCSWYFPRFLLRDRSLTQRYIASFMVLVTPCDSLPTMVKHSRLTRCPVVLLWWCIGDGALRCSFNLSPKDLPDSPIYSSRQTLHWHLNQYKSGINLIWGAFFPCTTPQTPLQPHFSNTIFGK